MNDEDLRRESGHVRARLDGLFKKDFGETGARIQKAHDGFHF